MQSEERKHVDAGAQKGARYIFTSRSGVIPDSRSIPQRPASSRGRNVN